MTATTIHETILIPSLIERLMNGRLRIPRHRQPLAWVQTDVYALLSSIGRGFPIGSLIAWETREPMESADRAGPVTLPARVPGTADYLIDGRHRATAILGALCGKTDQSTSTDGIDWRMYYDVDKEEFCRQRPGGPRPEDFPVDALADTAKFMAAAQRMTEAGPDTNRTQARVKKAENLAAAFRDYAVPISKLVDADMTAATTVFERIGRTGHRRTALELKTALEQRAEAQRR